MTEVSSPDLLVLHGVRLKGVAEDQAVARRFALEETVVSDLLLDFQAYGWITKSMFAGTGGWSLTETGRAENERQLAAELEQVGGRVVVHATYLEFLSLNARLQQACTDWQIRPTAADALAFNDHRDSAWDGRVIEELSALAQALKPIQDRLDGAIERLRGYDVRFVAALDRVLSGDMDWVDGTGTDSCHTVWFELHEDLIATLGLTRGQ